MKNKTPPKDRLILIEIKNHPSKSVSIWNDVEGQFVFSSLQSNMVNGKFNDHYFENEYCEEEDVLSWSEL